MSYRYLLTQVWREDEGFMTFEWVLLLTLLVIGVVAGLSGARDAIIDELGDVSDAITHFDQSYSVAEFNEDCGGNTAPVHAPGFSFGDSPAGVTRCGRTELAGQAP